MSSSLCIRNLPACLSLSLSSSISPLLDLLLPPFAYYPPPTRIPFSRLWAPFFIHRAPPILLASMSEEKLHLPKLAEDGSNWITYRNRMQWSMKMRGLGDHLTNTTTTKSYIDAGDVGGLSPSQRWAKDEIKASWLLDATIPDELFHNIKDTANVKEVWEKLKGVFEGKSRGVLVEVLTSASLLTCARSSQRIVL
ncbi:hypothetical protein V8E52_003054 [Russula decolorans]